jgi:hypothetical protein
MVLSGGLYMLYILREGDSGVLRIDSGRLERDGLAGLNVYDEQNKLIPGLSGTRIRSWAVIGPHGQRVRGWFDILADDASRFVLGEAYPD